MFFKILIENDVVEEVYLGFIKDGKEYYLQGEHYSGGIETEIYLKNVKVLKEAFGEDNCQFNSPYYECQSDEWSNISISTDHTTVYASTRNSNGFGE